MQRTLQEDCTMVTFVTRVIKVSVVAAFPILTTVAMFTSVEVKLSLHRPN